ncbi:methyl-accepting chemotaxis protein [Pseudoalteromonas tunicata]|uniref:Methyl-accepting chemotaxis protein n=1 Tax=Pseudoalteromonas tunicata D2 TaxID=87626 RepID=A4CEK2_9GAMM|nr:methyl-accepting chemotaxis protein [Pseudoalteromonas tunicata]ATC95995.1 methyl-accepting chemotaxis protein [Pseudoalteromonas tunicata]AXT31528.1 methyl-accepting chemotaxis protein [Pseudoalteromonas tunicata]EAR26731.1 methyl-accepting chemotaxis protein [Pseudoalteromonas tunicata D2]MDP4982226.1 methyl-accepting chemotaxis protein [Pseudoalteromonas tunicata]MDP5213342.1 methyl-accepting chemotaxis protein [Pseudoalteromonas tunicata]
MKEVALGKKLLWLTTSVVLITVVALSGVLWWQLKQNNQLLSEQAQKIILDEIEVKLNAKAGQESARIAGFINEAYRIPFTLAAELGLSAEKAPLSREAVQLLDMAVITQNENISSVYSQFEANGYDNLDQQYVAGASHSVVGSGALEIYITRDKDGQVLQQPVENSTDKYLDKVNEFGKREAEWYLCARDTKKPCLMEPYLYEISPGYSEMMTSLTVPILKNGRFVGVTGVDLNLPVLQKIAKELSSQLYNGKARVTLLSELDLIAGASHYEQKIGRPFKEAVQNDIFSSYQQLKQGKSLVSSDIDYLVSAPISIPLAESQWRLLIEVPKDLALSGALELKSTLADNAQSLGQTILMLGLVVALVVLVIMSAVIKTIIAPLNLIQTRVDNLASAEGDLTQTIVVEHHAELIALAGGFNKFLFKLRELISQLKDIAEQSRQQSINSANLSEESNRYLSEQFSEIESVVTAMNEMSATAEEVANASEFAAGQTNEITQHISDCEKSLSDAVKQVETMSHEISEANQAVAKVSARSRDINQILEVIRAIAEQTNLLALNAAIEAARAGEQGRGFAVVADEVRALASKTRASTDDISRLIESLQVEVANASGIIEKGVARASDSVKQTSFAFNTLHAVVEQVKAVSDQVTQIATAAEEQSAVTEEINRNLTRISDAAGHLSELSGQAGAGSAELAQLVHQQNTQLDKLRT